MLSTITIISLLVLILFLDAIRTKMDSKNNYNKDRRRKTKKKRHKKTSKYLQDKNPKSEDIWEVPSDYTSHNSEQFTSDCGSTLKFTAPEEEEQLLQEKEEKLLIEKDTENFQEMKIIPRIQK